MSYKFDIQLVICSHRVISVPTVISLDNCRHHLNLRWGLVLQQGDALISRARSLACTHFLNDAQAPFMLFIDDDILFNPQDVLRIYNSLINGYDLIGGIYPVSGASQLASYGWDGKLPVDDQIREIEFLATGFMGISRKCLEMIRDGLQLPVLNPNDWSRCWPFFEAQRSMTKERERGGDSIYISEDWDFPLVPETPILMSDFTWKSIKSVNIGDKIIGFGDPEVNSRKYLYGAVTDKVGKPGELWRIVTDKGEIISSPKHPFLVSSPSGYATRWITTEKMQRGQWLNMPIIPTVNPDITNQDFMLGYIKGLWEGDGTIEPKHRYGVLEMTDKEPIERAKGFLKNLGYETHKITHRKLSKPTWKPLWGLRCTYGIDKIVGVTIVNENIARGFLSGIYDAEGSYHEGLMRIANKNPSISDEIKLAFHFIGIEVEPVIRTDGLFEYSFSNQADCHKIIQSILPSIPRKYALEGQNGKKILLYEKAKILSVENTKTIGDTICLTTTTGNFIANGFASHNCQKARKVGIRVYADCGVQVGHLREQMFIPRNVLEVQGQQAMQAQAFGSMKKQQELILSLDTDLSEFLKQPVAEIQQKMGKWAQDKLGDMWRSKGGTVQEFYQNNEVYLYDLAAANRYLPYFQDRLGDLVNLRNQKVLDIGCGLGTAVFLLAGQENEVTGWDINQLCVDFCKFKKEKYKLGGEFILEQPDFSQFDAVVAVDMLEHIEDLQGFLKMLGAQMKSGAKLYHSDYFPRDKAWPMHFEEHAAHLNDWLREAGFAVWDNKWCVKL